ncbi:MAG: alkaline phosphatase family protein [Candidatus Saccharimonadales bacterium]
MKRKALSVLLLLIVIGIGLFAYFSTGTTTHHQTKVSNSSHSSNKNGATAGFSHVVIIVEENQPEANIIGNLNAPYINKLAKQYSFGVGYNAVTNPSLPNYIALTSGTTAGITNDCNPPSSICIANVRNIGDSLEAAGKTWKEYAESMPSPCYAYNSGEYAVKHNPFMYYPDITSNPSRCANHVVPFSQFASDLNTNLPNYSFITPNLCNDMHDCSIQTGDTWLSEQVPKILASKDFSEQKSLLVITWDEGYSSNNTVLVIFAGSAAKTGYVSTQSYNHYSLLHTIEANWGLPPLTQNDASANLMTDMLKQN